MPLIKEKQIIKAFIYDTSLYNCLNFSFSSSYHIIKEE